MDNCGQLWTDIAHSLYDGQERLFSADLKSWGKYGQKICNSALGGHDNRLEKNKITQSVTLGNLI